MLSRFPLIDGHNDLPWAIRRRYASGGKSGLEAALDAAAVDKHAPGFHTDIPRLVEGGVGGQFWSVYVPGTPHVAETTMNDVLDVAQAPVIFSHSSAKAVCDSPRNVPDDVLRRLTANGGVCMVAFVPAFVSQDCADWLVGLKKEAGRRGIDPRDLAGVFAIMDEYQAVAPAPQATLSQVADHVERVRAIAGIDHVGIGGDFDGTPDLPAGLEDVSRYPALFRELTRRGWTEGQCKALAGGNILRVLRAAESYAAR